MNLSTFVEPIIQTLTKAHATILAIYGQKDISIDIKTDQSPVTAADHASNAIIISGLEKISDLPILSEEGDTISSSTETYWLVDPLDGTKEFIAKNGEFTTNIALISKGRPIAGFVGRPTSGEIFYGLGLGEAYKRDSDGNTHKISVRKSPQKAPTCVFSRSHCNKEEAKIKSWLPAAQTQAAGSALKFCLLAEGKADLYFRRGPCMLWDTGAGQSVLESAGGALLTLDAMPLRYDLQQLLNPAFIALGDTSLPWQKLINL